MSLPNKVISLLSFPIWILFTLMVKVPHSKYYHTLVGVFLFLIPVCFFFFFEIMEERMVTRGLHSLPTPYSVIPLYPSRLPLLDLKHFFYLINNDVCQRDRVFIVVMVHTHPANREIRDAMRKNIPKEDLADIGVRRVFLMARSEWDDQELYRRTPQDRISEENVLHSDIIQGNFKEHYHNLTYKHIMGLQWVGKFCPQAKYVIKMDDDIVVDLFQFRDMLKYKYTSRTNLILGLLQIGAKPVRDKKSKWYVSEREFPENIFRNFVSGWAYAISGDAAMKIVNASSHFSYFWIDDVHITGTIAENQGVKREGLNRFYTIHREHMKCCITLPNHGSYLCDFIAGPTEGDVQLMEDTLKHARHCYINQCIRRSIEQRITKTCVTPYIHPLGPAGRGHGEVIAITR